jgi:hypothetical protein
VETTLTPQSPVPEPVPSLSLGARTVAVFARPARAWTGLEHRAQWWFPLLVALIVSVGGTVLIYHRAIVPTQMAQIERQVDSGQIPPEALPQIEEHVSGPLSMGISFAVVAISVPLMVCVFALLPWITAGFLLGHRFRYRDAFAVTAWAGLVAIPSQILTFVLGWVNQTMVGVHTGFGVVLPPEDVPSKLMTGLGLFLDHGIGPFALWYVVVLGLGAAAVSGADRRRVVLTMGAVWIALSAIVAVVSGLMTPGA